MYLDGQADDVRCDKGRRELARRNRAASLAWSKHVLAPRHRMDVGNDDLQAVKRAGVEDGQDGEHDDLAVVDVSARPALSAYVRKASAAPLPKPLSLRGQSH